MRLLKRTICWLLLQGLGYGLWAQAPIPVVDAPPDVAVLTKWVGHLKTTQVIPLDSVLQPSVQAQFTPLPAKPVFFSGWDPYYYWFRFCLRNRDTVARPYYISIGPVGYYHATLYQSRGGTFTAVGRTGNKYRFTQRPYPSMQGIYPVVLPPNTVDTFYVDMDYSGNYKTFAFVVTTARKLHQIESKGYFVFGIMVGILLLFAVFNVYLLFALKEKLHGWYALYIVALIYMLLKYEGYDEQFFPLDTELANRLTPLMGVGALTIFLLMNVVQIFLSNIDRKSRLFFWTRVVMINLLVSAAAHAVSFYVKNDYRVDQFFFEWANKSTALGMVFILINCIRSYTRGFKPALFILFGTVVFLVGGLEKMLFIDSTSYLFPPSLFEVGMVAEAIIISFGLMYRYQLFKREKEVLAQELAQQQSAAARQVLWAQEKERKRIAEDLHDELGSSLAALRLRLQHTSIPKESLAELLHIVDKAAKDARNIAHNLMPPEFEKTSLPDLLAAYYRRLNNETPVQFQFYYTGSGHSFDKSDELVIYRIVMELTNNILKHADATEATIQLIHHDGYLELMVEDNGKGISNTEATGIGLKNINSRVHYINGDIQIDSGRNGTTIVIRFPAKTIQHAQTH